MLTPRPFGFLGSGFFLHGLRCPSLRLLLLGPLLFCPPTLLPPSYRRPEIHLSANPERSPNFNILNPVTRAKLPLLE